MSNLKFGVFDIETKDWIYPYSIALFDGITYKEFFGKNCIRDFCKYALGYRYRAFTFFAHNGGKFDFNFIAEHLRFNKYDFKMVFQGSRCLNMKVYHTKEGTTKNRQTNWDSTNFSDSYAMLRFSLDKLTKSFNVKHKKINFMDKPSDKNDYDYLYELYKKNDERFFKYIENDVYGLYEVLEKFSGLVDENKGKLGMTIASTSLKTFKKSYLKFKLKMTDKAMNNEMKNAYYGGRTEIFKMYLKDNSYYCYDINSLYPYVMFNNVFPISPPRTIRFPTVDMIKENHGITQCEVIAPKNLYIPLLPYHYQVENTYKLIFPLGRFTGYWDNSMLVKALELGYKIKPVKMYIFDCEYIFKEYVNNFYKLKQSSKRDTPPYIIAKLLLNSLYGKFAQSQESEMLMKVNDPAKLKSLDVIGVFDIDNNIFRIKSESKGTFFIPQISIHVTALSQLELYKKMEYILDKGGTVGYCDTDSIFTDIEMPVSERLGDLKLEYPFLKGYFLLPKTYCVIMENGKCYIRAKGYQPSFQNQLDENIFKKALFKNDYSGFALETGEKKFNPMKTSYARHKTFISTDVIRKSIKTTYNKRKILKDFDTAPLVL